MFVIGGLLFNGRPVYGDQLYRISNVEVSERKKICYARVSGRGQKKDLDNQIEFFKTKFEFKWRGPYHIVKLGFPRTYYIMDSNGRWLDSTVNENDLAPWISRTIDDQDYFYDGSKRIIEPPTEM